MVIHLTLRQRDALLWLPPNGTAFTGIVPRSMISAMNSLLLVRPSLALDHYGPHGPRGGWRRKIWLTQEGIERATKERAK